MAGTEHTEIQQEYSHHLKTGPSGFRMVIFQTKFGSGFQMALAAILVKPFENRTKKSGFRMALDNNIDFLPFLYLDAPITASHI
jgi:hypothetical protein